MSEHSPLSWFPFDVAEWTSSPAISMMLPEQEGAYLRLLLAAWGKGDAEPSLPTDPMQLAQSSKLGARWKKLSPLILAQFEVRNGRLVSARQVTMWWAQQQKHAAAVTKATTAAKARHAKKPAPSTAPSTPQADLGLTPSIQIEEGTASPSTPYGVEREKHVPADDSGPAPAGAAPADVAATSANSTGDYLRAPSNREALARAGYRPDPDAAPATPSSLAENAESVRERADAYRSLLETSANDWMDLHPEETRAIGTEQRAASGLSRGRELSPWQTGTLRAAVVEQIRQRAGWPTLEQWDGADTFTPSEVPAPC